MIIIKVEDTLRSLDSNMRNPLYLRNSQIDELKEKIPLPPLQDSIGNLTELLEFKLVGNKLMVLPKEIGKLVKLTQLTINSELSDLPKEFGDLISLEEIYMGINSSMKFPESLSGLVALKSLSMYGNELEISNSLNIFAQLDSLELLKINGASILPKSIGDFQNLEKLDLSSNNLQKLPSNITSLSNLKYLNLYNSDSDKNAYGYEKKLKLTQKQKLWIFDLEKNGCVIENYDSRQEGESYLNKDILWWQTLDVWEELIVDKVDITNIESISFQKENIIDQQDGFLAWADNDTGLMWEVKNSYNIKDKYLWKESFQYVSKLNSESYAGFNDWIIPNLNMMISVCDYEPVLPLDQEYWTSIPFVRIDSHGYHGKVADYDGITVDKLRKMRNEENLNVICVRIFDINKALLFATKNELTDTVQILLNSGADINTVDKNGNTCLSISAHNSNLDLVQIMLETKAQVNTQNNRGDTALILASSRNNENIVKLLLDAGADINIQNKNGDTALMITSTNFDTNIFQIILDSGGLIDTRNKNGETALMIASANFKTAMLQIILDNGGLIDAQNNDGNTGLHLAINYILKEVKSTSMSAIIDLKNISTQSIQLLLNSGVNIDLQNNEGDTVFDLLNKIDNISTIDQETIIPRIEKIVSSIEIPEYY